MKSIYDYDNYRAFLKDYFDYQKKKKSFFSQRYFARKAGFNTHSFCGYVIKGERNLSDKTLKKIVKGLGIEGKKEKFFALMVKFTQAKTPQEKDFYFREMNSLRRESLFHRLEGTQYKYLKYWYVPVIRHIIANKKWNGNIAHLNSLIYPSPGEDSVKEAVDMLIEDGFISKDDSGFYKINKAKQINYYDVPEVFRNKLRKSIIELGVKSLSGLSKNERYTSYATLTMSKDTYHKITEIIQKAQKEAVDLVINDNKPEQVYEMVFQLFPVSSDLNTKEVIQ